MPRWHFGSPAIPTPIVLLSLLALSVPLLASAVSGGEPLRFEALLWLAALIPAFLLAYYRGWRGVAAGFAVGVGVFVVAESYMALTGSRPFDWPLVLSVAAMLAALSALLAGLAELLHRERERAERLALFDALTGLPNRRFFDLVLEKEFAAATRGRSVVLVAFDLDGFKAINDRHGHAGGDTTLKAFAEILADNTRSMNVSARLGGDEFASIVSSTSVEGALVFVRRVQEALEAAGTVPGGITASAGLALCTPEMDGPASLLAAADRALYVAKTSTPGQAWIDAGSTAPAG